MFYPTFFKLLTIFGIAVSISACMQSYNSENRQEIQKSLQEIEKEQLQIIQEMEIAVQEAIASGTIKRDSHNGPSELLFNTGWGIENVSIGQEFMQLDYGISRMKIYFSDYSFEGCDGHYTFGNTPCNNFEGFYIVKKNGNIDFRVRQTLAYCRENANFIENALLNADQFEVIDNRLNLKNSVSNISMFFKPDNIKIKTLANLWSFINECKNGW